ncbi:hypothetical protein NP233_g7318 [Leucocoprinus birnbaumii]|uniref:Uncharacterized protein n=1 Tax=Leucocoprinus birnbaumii TaxID=56174 RepID=A0AAD5VSQ9_9AGAR|nr:hypothetical protein NP233_g7318 [Leucocoprinus birnbaumii]
MPLLFNLRVAGRIRTLEPDGNFYDVQLEGPDIDSPWRVEWENGIQGIGLTMFYTAGDGESRSPIDGGGETRLLLLLIRKERGYGIPATDPFVRHGGPAT